MVEASQTHAREMERSAEELAAELRYDDNNNRNLYNNNLCDM